MQLGEHDLDPGQAGTRFVVDRDAATAVVHRDTTVGPQGDQDLPAEAAERLVHGVVDDLPQTMHQAPGVGGADVHGWSLAYRLEALEDQQVAGLVVAVLGCWTWLAARAETIPAAPGRGAPLLEAPGADLGDVATPNTPSGAAVRCRTVTLGFVT